MLEPLTEKSIIQLGQCLIGSPAYTCSPLVLSVRNLEALFRISGCENGWLPTRLSTMDLGSVGLAGFLKPSADEAQSSTLKRLRSFILTWSMKKLQPPGSCSKCQPGGSQYLSIFVCKGIICLFTMICMKISRVPKSPKLKWIDMAIEWLWSISS